MKTAFKSGNNVALVCKLTVLASSVAFAATALAQPALEEVLVTAQKREQSLQDVPASVSVISGESMRDFIGGGENIRAMSGRVPSLQIESSNGRQSPRFYIRGLGNYDFDVNASQPVSLIFDEITLQNAVLKSIPMFDIERIEVLKGPQGTLFGRNTPAGIVKVDSVRPSSETEGYVNIGYGSRDTQTYEGAIGGEVTDGVTARLSMKYLERDAWIDNTVNGSGDDFGGFDEFAYRLQVLFEPTDNFSALVKIHGFDQDGDHPQIFYANALTPGQEGTRSGFDEEVVSQDGSAGFEMDHIGGALHLTYEMSNALTLTSITGYDEVESFSRADVDGGLIGGPEVIGVLGRQAFFNVESGDGLDDHYQLSQELRLAGESGQFFYQVGLYYFDEDIDVRSNNFDSATGLKTSEDIASQQTTSSAIFGQVEYSVNDALSVIGGLRYTDDDVELETLPGPGSFAPNDIIKEDDSYVNWDLALNYDVDADWSIYGRVGNASRGPVTIGRFGFTSSADTETLTSIEAGFKANLWDDRARWNATVYAFEVEDQQLTATGGSANLNTLLNSDKTEGSGFETDLEILFTQDLRFSTNLSYNKTEIKDSELGVEQCSSNPGCTVKDPVIGVVNGPFGPATIVSVDGNSLPRAPEWMFNASLHYTYHLSSGQMYFNTDWNYRDESNIFLYESVEHIAEERWIGGLRIGYKNESEQLDVAIVGRNITDEVVVDGALNFLNMSAFVNEPAFWGVEVGYNF
ncbi:MAG: iron complex outermembrane receptor protein [Alcanivorax sp.]|jgi:iron complex outermembrane receptor protein